MYEDFMIIYYAHINMEEHLAASPVYLSLSHEPVNSLFSVSQKTFYNQHIK